MLSGSSADPHPDIFLMLKECASEPVQAVLFICYVEKRMYELRKQLACSCICSSSIAAAGVVADHQVPGNHNGAWQFLFEYLVPNSNLNS